MWKVFVVVILLLIIGSLFSGMIYMLKDKSDSKRTVKALTLRIGLSLALFIVLIVLMLTGVIEPNPSPLQK